jgi:hypothetical protein
MVGSIVEVAERHIRDGPGGVRRVSLPGAGWRWACLGRLEAGVGRVDRSEDAPDVVGVL